MVWVHGLVVVTALLTFIGRASGHAYLMGPPARNVVEGDRNGNCPHCGNGHGVCGDGNQWPKGSNYVGRPGKPVATFQPGSVVKLNVSLPVNHRGHSEFFICDHAITSEAGAVECLQRWPLLRVPPEEIYDDCVPNDPREDCQPIDPNFPGRWYHYEGLAFHHTSYRIPDDLECEHCTLQWFWPTANSAPFDSDSYKCYAALLRKLGWSVFNFCGWTCFSRNTPGNCDLTDTPGPHSPDPAAGSGFEEFRNCADIAVIASGPAGPSPAPTPAPAPVPTPPPASPKPKPKPQPTPEPETEPEPEPEPEPVPQPTPVSGCKATPGLNRGVLDEHCQRCLEGYKWWPCNEAILCTGCTPALVQSTQSAGIRLRGHGGSRVEDEMRSSALVQQNTELERSAHEAQQEL